MSRSGYSDDYDCNIELYRAAVERALRGKRGQAFLMELAAAMDAMPVKELIDGELVNEFGACCTIGVVCKSRQMDVSRLDYEDPDAVGHAMGIAPSMAAEIEFMNDEWGSPSETPTLRWQRMRKWVADNTQGNAERGTGSAERAEQGQS